MDSNRNVKMEGQNPPLTEACKQCRKHRREGLFVTFRASREEALDTETDDELVTDVKI